MPAALVAGLLCACGITALVLGLTTPGPLPDPAAATVPVSVRTEVPKVVSSVRHVRALTRSVPVGIRIPAIGVSAPVTKVGLNADGTVQVPPLNDHNLAGWYEYGPTPGQLGASVILGHVDSVTGISVFFYLKDLRKGDKIYVTLTNGKVATFVVDGVQNASKTSFPTHAVYGKISYPGLRVITCGGTFDPTTGHYTDNIIVYAQLA
ncbi:MAG TPA: class F sortase [Streptosporangiaceae bacterium]|jgi:sortase (surface protein transpeptidase)|nr:class F sortase [Streptosporangiaceae bacterium]